MSQDLHLKASGFLAEGSSFLCEYVLYVAKKYREIVRQTLRKVYTKVKKTEKSRLNYVPTYVLLFTV